MLARVWATRNRFLLLLEMQTDADTAKTNAEVPHYYRNRSTGKSNDTAPRNISQEVYILR